MAHHPTVENKLMMLKLKGYQLEVGYDLTNRKDYTFVRAIVPGDTRGDMIMLGQTIVYHPHFEYSTMLTVQKAFEYLGIEEF